MITSVNKDDNGIYAVDGIELINGVSSLSYIETFCGNTDSIEIL